MPLPAAAHDPSHHSHPSIAVPRPLAGHDVSGVLGPGSASGPIVLGGSGESTRPPLGQLDHPTSPSISLRAPSQTGRSARLTGPITADTSPHHLSGVAPRPVRRVAWVLGAIALVSAASIGATLMVLREDAEAPRSAASSMETAPSSIESSSRAASDAAQAPAVPAPDPRPAHPPAPVPAPSEPVAPLPVPTPSEPAAATMVEPSEASPDATDTSDIDIEVEADDPVAETSDDEPVEDPSSADKRPKHATRACIDRRARAEAALAGRDFKGLLAATSKASCWALAEQAARRGMRVQAYADLGRFDECIAAGRGVTSPQIRATVKTCEEQRAR